MAVGLSLVMLGIGSVLWAISDRLVRIGPFDRAAFGWAIVVELQPADDRLIVISQR